MFWQLSRFEDITWSVNRLGELLENLAEKAGLSTRRTTLPQPPSNLGQYGYEGVSWWIDSACKHLGLESESISTNYQALPELIKHGGPIVLRVPREGNQSEFDLVAVINSKGHRARVLTPDLKIRWIEIHKLRKAISYQIEEPILPQIGPLLTAAAVPEDRKARARQAILNDQLGQFPVQAGWMLRLSPGSPIPKQMSIAGMALPLTGMLAIHFIQQLLSLLAWVMIGRGIFQGHFDWGWMIAWMIVLLSAIPLGLIVSDLQGEFSLGSGALFKDRLLYGITMLKPDEIRHLGLGQFLGRIMESEAFEMLAFGGGFTAILSLVELGLAIYIFSQGAMSTVLITLFLVWLGIILLMVWKNFYRAREWSLAYREMTNELVENLVGHRTRLAQEDPQRWHDREDLLLNRYFRLSESLDISGQQIQSLTGRGWLILGLTAVGLGFVSGGATIQELAISLGGVLFASQGLGRLVNGAQSLISVRIAWEQVGPLFKAAERPVENPSLDMVAVNASRLVSEPAGINAIENEPKETDYGSFSDQSMQPVLQARDLVYRYRTAGRPVIDEVSLVINRGEHILLEGPSGGGKTTLAALLTGLRKPESGSLLLLGMDQQMVGEQEWRRKVAMAPQFHENHVFSETLGFNLLLGRRWPPTQPDLEEAEKIIRELGLGEVFDRMPSGFQQMLGESGWQLSHGERSRLYIARTLLQKSDLVILDESFGALDAENLKRSLQTVFTRAETLLVIAHP